MYDINKVNTHIIPIEFEYFSPDSLDEAINLLKKYGDEARILAGGTDLLVNIKQRVREPKYIISLKKLPLTYIEENEKGIRIGAATKLRMLERSSLIRGKFHVLYDAIKVIGSVQIRNMATLGGNLCNASPAADSAPALLVLEARAKIAGPDGEREVPIQEFLVGPRKTCLRNGEILKEIFVPYMPLNSSTSFLRIGRTSMDIAKINIAVLLRMTEGKVEECRIALGAVAPTPIRVKRAEEFLKGKVLSEEVLEEAGEIVSQEISPITDIRATAEWRREVSKVLTRDAILKAKEGKQNED